VITPLEGEIINGYLRTTTTSTLTRSGTESMKARDYKKEYGKYGKTEAAKKYRAGLNKYNRKKGTYGNGDGMDAAHESGRIRRFLKQSINRANNRPKKRASK
tara:strand:- start:7480 stop:7785 length:306 start_codon:yes stop_codon:yes gene_type:complete